MILGSRSRQGSWVGRCVWAEGWHCRPAVCWKRAWRPQEVLGNDQERFPGLITIRDFGLNLLKNVRLGSVGIIFIVRYWEWDHTIARCYEPLIKGLWMKKSHCTSRAVFLFCFCCDARSMQATFGDLTNENVWQLGYWTINEMFLFGDGL